MLAGRQSHAVLTFPEVLYDSGSFGRLTLEFGQGSLVYNNESTLLAVLNNTLPFAPPNATQTPLLPSVTRSGCASVLVGNTTENVYGLIQNATYLNPPGRLFNNATQTRSGDLSSPACAVQPVLEHPDRTQLTCSVHMQSANARRSDKCSTGCTGCQRHGTEVDPARSVPDEHVGCLEQLQLNGLRRRHGRLQACWSNGW